jgi:hypothetical protein
MSEYRESCSKRVANATIELPAVAFEFDLVALE